MNRRHFLSSSIAGSVALGVTGCPRSLQNGAERKAADARPFALDEITISQLREGLESGQYTSKSLVEMYLSHVAEIDKSGPAVNAVIELNPDAVQIAEELDRERVAGRVRGPLHGVPVMIKDNIDTADKMSTSAGSLALAESHAALDSGVAAALRSAGAVILAKTNLSEWANFRSSRSTSGWSGRGGQTRNPYALDRNPCGSSSGSGAAVSANLCAAAIGTETNGSIMCPSTINGIVGIKPTVGLVSRSGIIPISHTQDTAGPMARTLTDAAILLGALTGVDPRDEATRASEGRSFTDYTQFLDPNGLRGARIGVARSHWHRNPQVAQRAENAIAAMKAAGAEIIDPADLPGRDQFGGATFDVLLYEFKDGLNRYLASSSAPVKTLAALIEFNEKNAEREMPYFGQETLLQAQEKGPLTDKAYQAALATCLRLSRQEGIDKVMDEHKLDALVAPTGGPAWFTDLANGDHSSGGSSTPAAVSGYPNITVPMGFVFGLPVGISFFGRAWSEPTLIKIAYAFEQMTKHRKPPQFRPTAEISI